MKVKLLFQILFIQIFTKIILSKELLVKEEFQKPTITSSDVVGWSQNIIRTCEQKNIVEYTGQIFGVFSQDVTLNKKTYDKLAPHWSALVRLDLMLYGSVDSDEGDYAGISIDSNPIDRYTKYDSEGYKICSDSKGFWGTPYNDAIYPYQKNVTHTSDQLSIIINSKFTGTNKDSDYEGYAFKHVSVYIDTCYDSCQKCTGPSANQCTECIKNAVNVNGICTCSGSYFTYNFVCVLSCPNGFVGNPDTRICEQSKCLNNCSMCANQVCTQCNSSFKLINGECLAQCPSYSVDKGTFCEDKITGMKYGGYIFKGLYSANFGDSEIQGQGLKLVNFKNGGATFSSCSGERFVGGWNVAGSGSEIRRELPNFKPHWSIRIGFKYIMIDNWSNSESIQVILDNSNIIDKITRSSGTQAGNICGNSNTEVKGVYDKNMTHISSSLIITISNTLASSKSPFEASFGIREFFILVNYCQENCLECNNMGCTKCPQGTFLYQLNCEITCPTQLGFWANSNTNTCDICQGNCLQCDISATSCLKCKPGTYLSNKSCSSTCPDGFAPNQDTLTCDKCHQNCKTCSIYNDETKCTSCQGNRFLSGTQCLEKCPDGTYGEFNGNICAACNVNCLTCSGKTNANCLSCNIGKLYQPDDKTCGSTCKTTQYISINNCTACHTTCLTCSGGTDKDCLTCSSVSNRYFYQNQCLSQCPDQFYGDKNAQSCKKCDSTCFNCTGSNQDQCTQCSGYLYLNSGNKCLNTCPSGQFKNQANNKCEACDSNCLTCSQAKNMCTSCSSTMFLDTDGVCKNQCPDGKWTNQYNVQQKATKKCELCDSSCKTCGSTSKITCTSCNSPLFLDKAISQCVSTCPSKFYGNQSSWTCDKCESTCQECDGPNSNQCKQCSGNLYLDDNKCVTNCQGGKFSNQSTNNCDLCDKTQCKECISSNTNCTKCNTNLYLYNNTCQSSCPKGYFSNTSTGLCEKCNTSCETCYGSGADQCSNCNGNLFFEPVTKQCKPSCQQKYYPNSDNNQCMQCDQSCLECSGPLQDQCTACLNTLILFNNQCISKCPDQYFKDPNAQNCLSCDIRCFNCTDNSSKSCTACKGDLFLTSNKECLNVCPDGTYKESLDNNCQKCDQSCLTCSGPDKINCLKCTGQLFYEDNQCKQECYSGWKNSQNNKCDECNPQCSKCDGPNQNNCLECPNGTFLNPLEKTCVTECPVNYYSDSSNNKCEKCDQSCKNCLGSGQDKCTECEGQLFLKDGKFCSSSCNGSEYGNKLNNKCESCKSTCQNCEDQDDKCTSCNIGTFLINNKCEQNCPDSTFKNNNSNTCDICNQSCLTCSGPSDIECNSCKTGTFLDKSKKSCVSECPIQYFGDSITETCQKCVENCNQCSNDQKCSKCSSGFFLHEGQCISNCPTKYFNDSSTQNCTQCSQNCQTCFDSTVNGCLTCIPGTFKNVDNSSCLQENECPSNKYPDKDTQKCESCFSTCAECTGKDESQCKKCITDRFLYKGECLNDCPNNTFKQGTKCIDCHSSCSSCSGSSEFQCLSCLSGYLQEGTCLNECIQNYYPSLKNGQQVCLQCHEQCQKCSGPDSNNCTECPQNSFLYQNDCMKDCPVQYFGDSQANKCLKCIENCDQCSDNEKCLKCSSGFFLHNSQCLSNCPTKYFNDQNTQNCTQCSQNCQTCFDSTINGCLTCIPVTYKNVDNSSCVQENGCPSNKYPDKDTQKCESCFSTCAECTGKDENECKKCNSDRLLYKGECVKECPNKTFKQDKECIDCHSSCYSCDGSSQIQCLSCSLGYLQEGRCVNECIQNYYPALKSGQQVCLQCNKQCQKCNGPDSNNCTECPLDSFMFQNQCLKQCPAKYIYDINKVCQECKKSIKNNQCIEECDSKEYQDKDTLLCQSCAAECQSCYGPTTNECKKCSNDYFLDVQNDKCQQNCPDQYYPNKEKNLCEICDSQCKTCSNSGDTNCLSCNSPLILFEGKCLKDAPEGHFKDKEKEEFKKCHESCKTCDGPSQNDCLSCQKTDFALEKNCYKECPPTYFNNVTSMECTKCQGECKECKSSDYCLSCKNKYVYNGTCQATCDPILTFQDKHKNQCVQCHASCNNNGCLGPEQGDCINVGQSGFDLLIVKIFMFKTGLWIFYSVTGTILDLKNAKTQGKVGQVRPNTKQLSIQVTDNQVKDIIKREKKEIDIQGGTQLKINASPIRKKRTILTRASMINALPTSTEQAFPSKSIYGDDAEAESPTKKTMINFSTANIQSQLKILSNQQSQNDINNSPNSQSPHRDSPDSQINFVNFKKRSRPIRQSTLAKMGETAIPTFQNMEEQSSAENRFQEGSSKNMDSRSQLDEPKPKPNLISYPRKLYYTIIGNEILSVLTLYNPQRSRLFRSAMLYIKYLALFFMTYISQSANYSVLALGLLAAITFKGILQSFLSQIGICLRKTGLLALIFVMIIAGTDIYFWFLPKIQRLSTNLDTKWSFSYILLFTCDFLIIQSLISFTNYIVTVRSKFVDNKNPRNAILNFFFKQLALLQVKS